MGNVFDYFIFNILFKLIILLPYFFQINKIYIFHIYFLYIIRITLLIIIFVLK